MRFQEWLNNNTYYRGVSSNYKWNSMNPEGHQQEGPGIYFTSSPEDAATYGKVMKVELSFRKVVPLKGAIPIKEIKFLLEQAPDLSDTLMDWDEDPKRAFQNALQSIMQYSEGPHDAFQQVWIDFYHRNDSDEAYLNNMVRLGYDGVVVQKTPNITHAIAFIPNIVQIIE